MRGSDVVDRRRLEARGDVDAELLGGTEDLVVRVAKADRGAVGREDLDVQAQGLHLLDEHLEALGDSGLLDVLALDDGLVHLDAAEDVVGLDREELLEGVRGTVCLERPHLHLTEALTAELRLTTERLLGDHRVRAGRAGVDLVVHQVVQLQDVHVADGDRLRERLAGAAVEEAGLAGGADQALAVAVERRRVEQTRDLLLEGAVEHRGGDLRAGGRGVSGLGQALRPLGVALDVPALLGGPTEVGLQDLAEVHAAGDAHRVQDDVDRSPIGEERHVLDGQDLRDDALVAMTAGELVTLGDLALLGDVDHDALVDARAELVVVLRGELLDGDDRALFTVGNLQRGVAHLAALLVEDRAQQALLGRQLGLALRRDLADEDVAGPDLGADADDAALVEVGEQLRAHIGEVTGDLLLAELGVAGVDLVLLDVDRGEDVVLHQVLAEDDRVLEVVALPRHERDEQVLAERELAVLRGGAVRQDLADLHALAGVDDHAVVVAGALVGAVELPQVVARRAALVELDGDHIGGHLGDHTGLLRCD